MGYDARQVTMSQKHNISWQVSLSSKATAKGQLIKSKSLSLKGLGIFVYNKLKYKSVLLKLSLQIACKDLIQIKRRII